MSKNLDKIKDIMQKGENITKDDYKEIRKLYVKLPLEELSYDVVIYGVIERLYNSKLIDFEPTELAFDPI